MITGKRSHCTNRANEKTFTYDNADNMPLEAIVRLYNDGVAIRYRIPQGVKVTDDCTSFYVADGKDRWIAPYDFGNEQPFPHDTGPMELSSLGGATKGAVYAHCGVRSAK